MRHIYIYACGLAMGRGEQGSWRAETKSGAWRWRSDGTSRDFGENFSLVAPSKRGTQKTTPSQTERVWARDECMSVCEAVLERCGGPSASACSSLFPIHGHRYKCAAFCSVHPSQTQLRSSTLPISFNHCLCSHTTSPVSPTHTGILHSFTPRILRPTFQEPQLA